MSDYEAAFAKQSKRQKQRRWRQSKIGTQAGLGSSVTIHLSSEEVAILDHIAIADYEDRPSNRSGMRDENPPSRSRAIRLLIRNYVLTHAVGEGRISALAKMRSEIGAFWINERSWRASSNERRRKLSNSGDWEILQPSPPWVDLKAETKKPK